MTGLQYPTHEKMQSSFWFGKTLTDVGLQSPALWVCCRRRWTPTPHHGGRGRVSAGQRTAGVISGPGIHLIRGPSATQCCSERRIRRKVGRLSSLHNGFLPWRFLSANSDSMKWRHTQGSAALPHLSPDSRWRRVLRCWCWQGTVVYN